jgi:hypothetical protein
MKSCYLSFQNPGGDYPGQGQRALEGQSWCSANKYSVNTVGVAVGSGEDTGSSAGSVPGWAFADKHNSSTWGQQMAFDFKKRDDFTL